MLILKPVALAETVLCKSKIPKQESAHSVAHHIPKPRIFIPKLHAHMLLIPSDFAFHSCSSSAACLVTSAGKNLLFAAILIERTFSGVGLRISNTEMSAFASLNSQLRTSTALRESTNVFVSWSSSSYKGKGRTYFQKSAMVSQHRLRRGMSPSSWRHWTSEQT